MDTRYWGPSGWKLLHSITFNYSKEKKEFYKEFFYNIAFVLPCKFCRKSYSEYITELPVDLSSKENFTKWLWKIHNKVNDKLRTQGFCKEENPEFSFVKKMYNQKLSQGCSKVNFEGWEFLFSVVEGHPYSKLSLVSKPFASYEERNTPLERNKNNSMEPSERLLYYKKFWELVPEVLPFQEWTTLWKKFDSSHYNTRASLLKNLYKIRCGLEAELELENKTQFLSLCKELRRYKSGCNKSTRSKTCRSQRKK
jgi:hypothetical protein